MIHCQLFRYLRKEGADVEVRLRKERHPADRDRHRAFRNYRFPQTPRSLVGNDAVNDYPLGGINFDLPPLVDEPV